MAWDDEIVTIVREMISDVDSPQKYTDDRISTAILTAAQNVITRVEFPLTYIIDITNGTIKPDPTDRTNSTRDENFINLVALKCSANIMIGESRLAGNQSIGIRDGTSALDLRRDPRLVKTMIDTFVNAFEDAVFQYRVGGGTNGKVIVGPYKYNIGMGQDYPYFGANGDGYRWNRGY